MNAKYFLSACLLAACQNNTATLDESCLIEERPVFSASSPTSVAASLPVEVKPEVVEVTPAPARRPMPTPEEAELRLVSSFGEKHFIVLQKSEYDTLAKGKAKLISKKEQHAVRRDVDMNLLPESTRAWAGQEVSLLQKDNTFCDAKVSGLALLGQIYLSDDETAKKGSASIFALAQERGSAYVVAELEPNECRDVRFARLASLPTPELFTPAKATKELRKAVLPLMRALPAYKAVQKRYEEYRQNTPTENKRWESYYGSKPVIGTFSTSTETFVYASIKHDGGCGDFYGSLFALWRLNEDQSLSLVHFDESGVIPEVALDLNGDGTFEFLQDNNWERLEDGTYKTGYYLHIPYEQEGCSC